MISLSKRFLVRSRQATCCLLAVGMLMSLAPAMAQLPGELSGQWYHPEQSGHGISVVIPGNSRAVAIWHAYDLDGNPLTLYLDGRIEGREIIGSVFAPSGMRFSLFDPAELVLPIWGEARIRFNSCDEAEFSWNTDWPVYPDGELTLRRLASVQGTECELPRANQWVQGHYSGTIQFSPRVSGRMSGIVDSLGQLWAIETTRIRWTGEEHFQHRLGLLGETSQSAEGDAPEAKPILLRALNQQDMLGRGSFGRGLAQPVDGSSGLETQVSQYREDPAGFSFAWTSINELGSRFYDIELAAAAEGSAESLVAPISEQGLAGQYRALDWDSGDDPRPSETIRFEVTDSGEGCLIIQQDESGHDCRYRVRFDFSESDSGIMPVYLSETNFPLRPGIRGRAWMTRRGGSDHLHIMARGYGKSFGFVVTR